MVSNFSAASRASPASRWRAPDCREGRADRRRPPPPAFLAGSRRGRMQAPAPSSTAAARRPFKPSEPGDVHELCPVGRSSDSRDSGGGDVSKSRSPPNDGRPVAEATRSPSFLRQRVRALNFRCEGRGRHARRAAPRALPAVSSARVGGAQATRRSVSREQRGKRQRIQLVAALDATGRGPGSAQPASARSPIVSSTLWRTNSSG